MVKNVQIDLRLFVAICRYFLSDDELQTSEIDDIRQQLQLKLSKVLSRELFARYKQAQTEAEREVAYQDYLKGRYEL